MSVSKRERLEAVIQSQVADRLPVALWRHFPVDDQDPKDLAQAAIEFQNLYDFDFVKITPASSFCIKDWGVDDEWRGNFEGTREYTKRIILDPEDWKSLQPLDIAVGALADQLICLDYLEAEFSSEVPIIQTIFSPLAQAKNLAGQDRLLEHLRKNPEWVLEGLKTITHTTLSFIEAAKTRGIAGIFYAIQHATYRDFDREAYQKFGMQFDQLLLESVEDLWLNVLHLHGEAIMFDVVHELPAQVVNWHDRETAPSLEVGKSEVQGAVCGGLRRWDTMVLGGPIRVQEEALDAIQALGGTGMVLGTGCVVPIIASHSGLLAARSVVEEDQS
jgi:uroporphyrinogen decarboxylase